MQLATALVINVMQLCAHMKIEPMGGEDSELLNRMQAAGLVLTTCVPTPPAPFPPLWSHTFSSNA